MDREVLAEMIKEVIDDALEGHLASVHEEISDLRGEMTDEFKKVRQEMREGFASLKSEMGAIHNRIDNETFARKELEQRVRGAVPNMREAPSTQ